MQPSREDAWALFCEWTESDSLRKHGGRAVRVHRGLRPGATYRDSRPPKSVKKKLKQPSFAAGVDREALRRGAAELGVDFDEHIRFVTAAMEDHAQELGLAGEGERPD